MPSASRLNKDVVRRILTRYYRPAPGGGGPSWLSVIGHARDRLWSVDLFRTESILLKSYWVMVVMDVYTRRIVGFGVAAANLDGRQVCRMFNHAIARQTLPRHLSSDHDPLFRFHRWRANLRVLEVDEIKTIPATPRSHAFVERLIGTIRREYLDRIWFWNQSDLERRLEDYKVLSTLTSFASVSLATRSRTNVLSPPRTLNSAISPGSCFKDSMNKSGRWSDMSVHV